MAQRQGLTEKLPDPCSLITAFSDLTPAISTIRIKGTEQNKQIPRLIWIFANQSRHF